MAKIVVNNGVEQGRELKLAGQQVVIGRYSFCDLVLSDKNISRQHARVTSRDGRYFIEDLNSLNGTYVNGERIAERTPLYDQDRLQIFEAKLTFVDPGQPRPAAGVASTRDFPDVVESSRRIVNALDPSVESPARERLRAVLETTRNLGTSLDEEAVVEKILNGVFTLFRQADRGYVVFAKEGGRLLELKAFKQGDEQTNVGFDLPPLGQELVRRVIAQEQAVLSADDGDGPSESIFEAPRRSIICAPLLCPPATPLGAVYVETSDEQRAFNDEDLEVLLSVATIGGQAVQYTRSHRAALQIESQRRELEMARQVQRHFLPQRRPIVQGYQFFDFYRSAKEVGGDYYGYVPLPNERLAIAVGDVSGKGISAALMMARLCAEVRYFLATSDSPAEAVARLNAELVRPTFDQHFITFSLVVLDSARHRVTVVNAGHQPALRRDAKGVIDELKVGGRGLPLGVSSDSEYRQQDFELAVDDLVLMYTDGITEAMNEDGKLYGEERLRQVFSSGPSEAGSFGQVLMTDVEAFTGRRAQSDDICLACFRRL